MSERCFVGPYRMRWRWYVEADGETVSRGQLHATEHAAIRTAAERGISTLSRYQHAHEHRGSLEHTQDVASGRQAMLDDVAHELGITFGPPWTVR